MVRAEALLRVLREPFGDSGASTHEDVPRLVPGTQPRSGGQIKRLKRAAGESDRWMRPFMAAEA